MHKFIVYPGNHPEVIRDVIIKRGNYQEITAADNTSDAEFIWRPCNFSASHLSKLESVSTTKPLSCIIFNHLPNLKGICSKANLIASMRRFYSSYAASATENYNLFHSTPTTFIISPDTDEMSKFQQRYKEFQSKFYTNDIIPPKHCKENVWIVKPSNLNQGRGIEIFDCYSDIIKFINSKKGVYVIQKYIEKPLLYNCRKFDIRVWALATSTGKLYFYEYGYLRTSSSEYKLLDNTKWIHLTNNCFQCNGTKYGSYEDGNTLSFDDFQAYLDKIHSGIEVYRHIIPRIKDLIIDTYMSVMHECNPLNKEGCFELLGFDFMIDEDYRVWLIECNENPYIGLPNDYIKGMVPRMLNNMLRIVLDPHIAPKTDPFSLETENNWELIFEGKAYNGYITIVCNQRRPFSTDLYPLGSSNLLVYK